MTVGGEAINVLKNEIILGWTARGALNNRRIFPHKRGSPDDWFLVGAQRSDLGKSPLHGAYTDDFEEA